MNKWSIDFGAFGFALKAGDGCHIRLDGLGRHTHCWLDYYGQMQCEES